MKKRINITLGFACYMIGGIASLYIGGWLMVVLPVKDMVNSFINHNLSAYLVFVDCIKIFFSSTLAGFVWCLGYIIYNYFKGTEDPDWEELEG